MTGLDTNVLVRFLVQDDPDQARTALSFLHENCTRDDPGFINRIVLCELAWVLKSTFRCTREEVARAIEGLASMAEVRIEDIEETWQALAVYRSGEADFADALLAVTNRTRGCEATVTFDRRAGSIAGMRLLKQ